MVVVLAIAIDIATRYRKSPIRSIAIANRDIDSEPVPYGVDISLLPQVENTPLRSSAHEIEKGYQERGLRDQKPHHPFDKIHLDALFDFPHFRP